MKVAVYVSAVPSSPRNQSKRDYLSRFAQGVSLSGDCVEIVDQVDRVVSADIAVLQGWVGVKSSPHLLQRRRVIDQQAALGRHTLVIDSNLFGFLDPGARDRYLRYSLDGVFANTGYYFDCNPDPSRWVEIQSSYGHPVKPWLNRGAGVLVCLQRSQGWSMCGLQPLDWLSTVLPQLQHLGRRVIIRAHPGDPDQARQVHARWPWVEISQSSDIREDLDRAWCTVTYNSSPAVASLLWGVPTFVTDPVPQRSQTWPWAATDLALIENPPQFDRQPLFEKISQSHHATAELASGRAWQFMRARLP